MAILIGAGQFAYEVFPDWAKLPKGWNFLEVVDVGVDNQDRVYLFNRGPHPLMIFDRQGNLLNSWGEGMFQRPHGLTIGPENTIYLVDDGAHVVQQFTPEGKLLMTIGTPGKGAGFMSGKPFQQPTKVAIEEKTGDLYISDGYGNARVHKFSSQGKYLFSWGESGTDPGQFNLVHSVAVDKKGLVYVADRENHRLQIFNEEGFFLKQWVNLHRPCALHIAGKEEQLVYIGELPPAYPFNQNYPHIGGRLLIYNLQGERLAILGDIQAGSHPHQFLAPHGLAIDSHGDIYVGEVSWSFRGKNLTPPQELPSFRKLVKIS